MSVPSSSSAQPATPRATTSDISTVDLDLSLEDISEAESTETIIANTCGCKMGPKNSPCSLQTPLWSSEMRAAQTRIGSAQIRACRTTDTQHSCETHHEKISDKSRTKYFVLELSFLDLTIKGNGTSMTTLGCTTLAADLTCPKPKLPTNSTQPTTSTPNRTNLRKRKRTCTVCKDPGHTKKTCPNKWRLVTMWNCNTELVLAVFPLFYITSCRTGSTQDVMFGLVSQ